MSEAKNTRQSGHAKKCAETPIPCAINCLLDVLTKPWNMHILWTLGNDGPTRFGALRRRVDGISARVLAERLRLLEERGFIYRDYEPTIPPAVTYGLTHRMQEMEPVLKQMSKLGQKWYEEDVKSGRLKLEDGIVNEGQSKRKETGHT